MGMLKFKKTGHHKEAEASDGWYEMENGSSTAQNNPLKSVLAVGRQGQAEELAMLLKHDSIQSPQAEQKKRATLSLQHVIFHITVVSGEHIPKKVTFNHKISPICLQL